MDMKQISVRLHRDRFPDSHTRSAIQSGVMTGRKSVRGAFARGALIVAGCVCVATGSALAQPAAAGAASAATAPIPPSAADASVASPSDYVIGPDDQLSVVFWRDKDLSADVVVRPDGKI